MLVCELVNAAVQPDSCLHSFGKFELLFTFYKITDQVAGDDAALAQR